MTCNGLLLVTRRRRHADLSKAFVELSEDACLVEHLALVAMLVVVGDALAKVAWQLAIDHVLFDLLELRITIIIIIIIITVVTFLSVLSTVSSLKRTCCVCK